jgi:outer membrane autotransporter protein
LWLAQGQKTGSFNVSSWLFGARGGYVFKTGSLQVIPSVGVKFLSLRQSGFADKLDAVALANGVQANFFEARSGHQLDIPPRIKFSAAFEAGSATVTPELRLGYNFAVDKLDNSMEVGFVGSPVTWEVVGTKSLGHAFQAGLGLKIDTGGLLEAFINYDIDVSNNYVGHNAFFGLGFSF